jgi:hypothetical protein
MAARDKTRLIDVPVFWGDSPQKIIPFCFSKKQGVAFRNYLAPPTYTRSKMKSGFQIVAEAYSS